MAKPTAVWGIDIGQVALKALKVRNVAGELQVEAFDVIEHAKILSQPDADRKQLIRAALEQFLVRQDVSHCLLAVSVPGQSGFSRFVKLPPVEPKKIPDIVRYEAEQQIPFPISEVNWCWQPFLSPDSPDVEVGIFAMKRTDVSEVLKELSAVGLAVDLVQMAPLALCNFMSYDAQLAGDGATLLVDIGADKTDLVVSDGVRIWTRTIQIGGNNFTEALVRAFKLSFSKAEKLKRTAATSKYARQIFQAMRPVFADLVQEIQRSIGYYTSLHRETRFRRLVGLGNGFRLPGLQKFLEQNLNVPVARIDSYNRLATGPSVTAPTFNEHVLSFPVAYGLAVQALDESRVQTNLLPNEIVRQRMWNKKRPLFAVAAVLLVAFFCEMAFRDFADKSALAANEPKAEQSKQIAGRLERLRKEYRRHDTQQEEEKKQIAEYVSLLGYRDYWPSVLSMISETIKNVAGDQHFLAEYDLARDEGARSAVLDSLKRKPRNERKLMTILSLKSHYVADLSGSAEPGLAEGEGAQYGHRAVQQQAAPGKRGFRLELKGLTPYRRDLVHQDLIRGLSEESRKVLESLPSVGFVSFSPKSDLYSYRQHMEGTARSDERPGLLPTGAARPKTPKVGEKEKQYPDPLFPDEDMAEDTVFEVTWEVSIQGDGVLPPAVAEAGR